ncbi:MAG: PQQ-dependent sugar dehydrogenase [Betaproteobacteria bacterium]
MKGAVLRRLGAVAALLALAACGGSVDRQDPTATLTAPFSGATGLTGMLVLSADASDNESVQRVEFQVDGVEVGRVETPPYTVTFDTSVLTAGQHVVRARARDEVKRFSPWSSATVQIAGDRGAPAGFEKNEAWISGLAGATAFAQAADGRLFVAQQTGELRVVKNEQLLDAPFVHLVVDASGERGLIGVALDPDFASNGFVYVHYTTTQGGTHNRISRFTANGDVAVAGSEQVLVDLPALSSATDRNGGALHFGADGKLYVGVGDNADPARAPDAGSPFGKLLRFNDDGSVPDDGPQAATQSGLARAVWARGLRNPATFAFNPDNGRLFIDDIGQAAWEEIDEGAAGADYGWPDSEGASVPSGITPPLFAYPHAASNPPGVGPGGFFVGASIVGGAFYPLSSGNFPDNVRGNYFFADRGARFVARLDLGNDNAAYAFASVTDNPVDLLVGSDGALYVLTRSAITRIRIPP